MNYCRAGQKRVRSLAHMFHPFENNKSCQRAIISTILSQSLQRPQSKFIINDKNPP